MTTATVKRPASLNLYDTKASANAPVVTREPACVNPDCGLTLDAIAKARIVRYNGLCTDCVDSGVVAPATAETVPAQRAEEPGTHEGVPVCGNCDANTVNLGGVPYCSETCKVEAAAAEAKKAAKARAPKPLPAEVREIVTWQIRDALTDYEIRVGLNNAWSLRQGQRFTPDAIAAAARVWFQDYDHCGFAERGQRTTKVLRVLNAVSRHVEG